MALVEPVRAPTRRPRAPDQWATLRRPLATSADRTTLVPSVTSFMHGDEDPGWWNFISDAWVREPGCYALQVDLLSASYRFVAFEVGP